MKWPNSIGLEGWSYSAPYFPMEANFRGRSPFYYPAIARARIAVVHVSPSSDSQGGDASVPEEG